MTGKYLLGNSDVEFWTDWTVKLVDMVCISITIYLCQERCRKKSGRYTFRSKNDFVEPDWRIIKYRKSFLPFAISLWNRLNENTRKITNYESFKDTLMANTIDNPLFYVGSRQEQIIMAKLRMGGSNLNGHLYSMKLIDSPACSCRFINENEFHFFLVCPLYKRPRVTLQNAMGNIAPFTLRTLLYGSENLDLTVNKRIVTETLRFIKDSKSSIRDCMILYCVEFMF